jgi:hypothetical protein
MIFIKRRMNVKRCLYDWKLKIAMPSFVGRAFARSEATKQSVNIG